MTSEASMVNNTGTIALETDRLLLRQFQYADSDDMLKYWISDEKIQSMYSEPTYKTQEELRPLLDKYISGYQKEDYYRWAIVEKGSDLCIGQIALFFVSTANECCEMEYCLGSDFHRKGYMTEAVNRILQFCFEDVNFHRVQVSHNSLNRASKGVIDKCGFVYEGTFRDYFCMNDEYVSRLYYSMLKGEWESKAVKRKHSDS